VDQEQPYPCQLENSEHHYDTEQSLQQRSVPTFYLNPELHPYQMDNCSTAQAAGNEIWQVAGLAISLYDCLFMVRDSSKQF